MKKIILAVFAACCMISSLSAQKAFEKGNIVVDGGAALSIYTTHVHQEFGAFKHDTTDKAGGGCYALRGEYGVTNWLGVGARFGFTNFIDTKDSVTNYTPTTRGLDVNFSLNFHFIKTRRFDMPLYMNFGYAKFMSNSNDPLNTKAKGNGSGFGMGLMPRIYFGDHIGMHFLLGFQSYNFGNIHYSNDNDSNLNKTWDAKVTLKASGTQIGIGLQYKL